MPNLLHRIYGISEASSGRRPQMAEFTGINWSVPTAYNMLFCLPMWEPPGMPCLDLGPLGVVGQPIGTILRSQDTYFGDVYVGDGVTRGYKFDYIRELDFGIGRQSFSASFWFNAPVNYSPAVDVYLLAYDNPSSSPTAFAGFACSFDNGGTIAFNRGSSTEPDDGFKTTNDVFRTPGWHHFAMSHVPSASGATGTGYCAYYLDGKLNSVKPNTSNIGPLGAAVPFYIGVDDDGSSQPFGGGGLGNCMFCDLRIYRDALSDDRAAAMYHPDTRWEIYYPPKKAYFFTPPTAQSLSRTFSDAPATTDSLVKAVTTAKTLADSPATTDTLARTEVLARAFSDAPSTSDALARTEVLSRSFADSPTTADSLSRSVALATRTLSDSPSTVDSVVRTEVLARSLGDSPETSDSLAKIISLTRTLSDSPTTSDSVTRTVSLLRLLNDAPTTSDSLARVETLVRAMSDSPTTADSLAKSLVIVRAISDSPVTSDSMARTAALARTFVAAPSTSDSLTAISGSNLRSFADAPATSTTFTKLVTLTRTLGDALATSDSFTKTVSLTTKTLSDAPVTSDTLVRVEALTRRFSDLPVTSDSLVGTSSSGGVAHSPVFIFAGWGNV